MPTPFSRDNHQIAKQLGESQVFRDYERAFHEATGLPLALRTVEALGLPLHGRAGESPFCALMASSNQSCAACLQLQRKVEDQAHLQPKTLRCFAGLCDSLVPVRVGENLVAFLQTGQVLLHQPTREQFARTTRQLLKWGAEIDVKRLEEAYFQTRVLPRAQYEAMLRLLEIFARHLSSLSNQLSVAREHEEPPMVARARVIITEQSSDELSLKTVARSVNTSAFYFCKMFKRTTGLTFTDYLARVRVEKAKNLLMNPQKRISETAFETGFQSLSQFNRVFRRVAGESPTAYRDHLHGADRN